MVKKSNEFHQNVLFFVTFRIHFRGLTLKYFPIQKYLKRISQFRGRAYLNESAFFERLRNNKEK